MTTTTPTTTTPTTTTPTTTTPTTTTPTTGTPTTGTALARPGLALGALAAAQFLVTLESSIVNVALPEISRDLALGPEASGWVVNAYLVAFAGLMLLGGRLADLFPRRGVFLGGLALFTAASAVAGLAPDGATLLAGRVLQGVGGAAMAPAALSLVVRLFPTGPARTRALGVWGGVSGAGAVVGVLAGGVLSDAVGWPWIFLVNVPLAALVGVGVLVAVPASPGRRGSLDLVGAVTVTASSGGLCLAVVQGSARGWTSASTLVPLAVAAVCLVTLVAAERRADDPLLPPSVVARWSLVQANLSMLVLGAVMVGLFFFLPQFQQGVLGMSPALVGASQVPIAVAITLGSAAAGRVARAAGSGRRGLVVAGLVLLAGLTWLTRADAEASYAADLLGPFAMVGLGLGVAFVLVTAAAVTAAGPEDAGLASGLVNASRQTGGALGLAALVSLSVVPDGFDPHAAFRGVVGLTALLLLLAVLPSGRAARP